MTLLAAVALATSLPGLQESPLDAAIKANSRPVTVSAQGLSGPGLDLIWAASASAGFFGIGEIHAVEQVPAIARGLFTALQQTRDFQYFAVENDPLTGRELSGKALKGSREKIVEFARRYPNAIAFNFDPELELLAAIGSTSKAKWQPIWGLDQNIGSLHVLDRLERLAQDESSREAAKRLIAKVRPIESKRGSAQSHYMSTEEAEKDLATLFESYRTFKDDEADMLLDALIGSNRIYLNYKKATQGELTGYHSNFEREEYIKTTFASHYAQAEKATPKEPAPKVVVKMGLNHLFRGFGLHNVFSFGNFLSEFATAKGTSSFHLALLTNGKPGEFGALTYDWLKPFLAAGSTDASFVVDLRPLRPLGHARKIDLTADQRRFVWGYDVVVFIANPVQATTRLTGVESP